MLYIQCVLLGLHTPNMCIYLTSIYQSDSLKRTYKFKRDTFFLGKMISHLVVAVNDPSCCGSSGA